MHFAILGNADSWYVADIRRAAELRGHTATRVEYRGLFAMLADDGVRLGETPAEAAKEAPSLGEQLANLSRCDAVIVRTMPPGSLEQVVFRMDALLMLEARGVQVVNPPKSIECAVDKFLTSARLARAGIPTPRTIVCQDFDSAMLAFEQLGGDVVVKPIFGAEGRGIMRVDDADLAVRAFRTLERLDAVIYLQEFIHHPGYDTRILWLDGRPLGAIRRHSDDFRTNISRQARAERHQPTDLELKLAAAAVDATGPRIAGIDLLTDHDGRTYVIEVNAVPGWQGFRRATGIDVAKALVEAIEAGNDSERIA
jgi:ribosomal protein S6--L-glutamate ligase